MDNEKQTKRQQIATTRTDCDKGSNEIQWKINNKWNKSDNILFDNQ